MECECVVCMDSAPELVALGCSCRALAGFAHVECVARFARATGHWRECRTCRRTFTGKMLVALSEARWAIARGAGVPDAERVAAMRHVAVAYAERGRYTDAERIARVALAAAETVFGADDHASLSAAAELANILQLSGSPSALEEAIAIHARVVDTRVAALGAQHGLTLSARSSLASCLSDRGSPSDLALAERTQRAMLEAETSAFGARHVTTLTTQCDLALTLTTRRKYSDARAVYDTLVPTLESELGPDHPTTVVTIGNMASCLSGSGEHEAAAAVLERVVRSARRVFGSVHPDTRIAKRNLAKTRSVVRKSRATRALN